MGTDILGCDFVPHGTVKHKKTKKRKLESDVVLTCSLPNSNSCLSESSFPRSSSPFSEDCSTSYRQMALKQGRSESLGIKWWTPQKKQVLRKGESAVRLSWE